MLKISKLTDYATVIMSFLALDFEKILSATTIAKETHLGVPTVSKILKMLVCADLVKSYRGTEGGYQIARPAMEISIADVVSAVEGKFAMTECCANTNSCSLDSSCSIKENWQIINKIIFNALSKVSLKDMTCSLTTHGISIKVENLKYVKSLS